MSKFCTNCGNPLDDNAAFCAKCGKKTETADTVPETVSEPVEKQETDSVPEAASEPAEKQETDTVSEAVSEPVEKQETDVVPETASEPAEEQTAEAPQAEVSEQPDNAASEPVQTEGENAKDSSTPLDQGIAFAKEKLGDKYETFKKSPNRDRYIGFAAIGVLVIVAVIVVLTIIFSGGYKSTVESYYDFQESFKYSDFKNACPDVIFDAQVESFYDGDVDELKDTLVRQLENIEDNYDDYDVDYDIKDTKDFNKKQRTNLEDSLIDEYGDYTDDDITVSSAKEVKVRVKTSYDDDTERSTEYLIVAKVNGDWGVVDQGSDSLIDDYND